MIQLKIFKKKQRNIQRRIRVNMLTDLIRQSLSTNLTCQLLQNVRNNYPFQVNNNNDDDDDRQSNENDYQSPTQTFNVAYYYSIVQSCLFLSIHYARLTFNEEKTNPINPIKHVCCQRFDQVNTVCCELFYQCLGFHNFISIANETDKF